MIRGVQAGEFQLTTTQTGSGTISRCSHSVVRFKKNSNLPLMASFCGHLTINLCQAILRDKCPYIFVSLTLSLSLSLSLSPPQKFTPGILLPSLLPICCCLLRPRQLLAALPLVRSCSAHRGLIWERDVVNSGDGIAEKQRSGR